VAIFAADFSFRPLTNLSSWLAFVSFRRTEYRRAVLFLLLLALLNLFFFSFLF